MTIASERVFGIIFSVDSYSCNNDQTFNQSRLYFDFVINKHLGLVKVVLMCLILSTRTSIITMIIFPCMLIGFLIDVLLLDKI